jgi:8-oxo-dGTP diphosphatase
MRERQVPEQPRLRVVGTADDAGVVADFLLAHGEDPVHALASRGWVVDTVDDVASISEPRHELAISYRVRAEMAGDRPPEAGPPPRDEGLVLREGERAHPYQRTAAYGVVTSERGVLLTQLSDSTNAAGQWNLPGGGIDPGESPLEALHREVWEESGQRVADARLLDLHTQHWVGRAPSGRLEDFHAVRIIYAADCPEPTDPVIHDVGGSTADVRWVRAGDLGGYRLTRSVAPHILRWLGAGG